VPDAVALAEDVGEGVADHLVGAEAQVSHCGNRIRQWQSRHLVKADLITLIRQFKLWQFKSGLFKSWLFKLWQFKSWLFKLWLFKLWLFKLWQFKLWLFKLWLLKLWLLK
jgi:hypothetical protein